MLRYQDNLNFISVDIGNFDVNVATEIAGNFAKPIEFFPDTSSGSVVITLSSNTVTVTAGGQTQSATLPTGQPLTNTIGLLLHTAGTTFSSLDASPVATCSCFTLSNVTVSGSYSVTCQ